MNLHIKINTDNAAFDDGEQNNEIARILRDLADTIEDGNIPNRVMDINGNVVGSLSCTSTLTTFHRSL